MPIDLLKKDLETQDSQAPQDTGGISLTPEALQNRPLISLPPELLEERTQLAMFAMDRTEPIDATSYSFDIGRGREDERRKADWQEVNARNQQEMDAYLVALAEQKQRPLTPHETAVLRDAVSQKQFPEYKGIWEREAAEKYLTRGIPGDQLAAASETSQHTVDNGMDVASETIRKMLRVRNYAADLEAQYAKDSTAKAIAQGAKSFIPWYDQWKNRQAAQAAGIDYDTFLLRGQLLDDMLLDLWATPDAGDQFEDKFEAVLGELKDVSPLLAAEFVERFLNGYDSEQRFIDDGISVLDAADIGLILKFGGKAIMKSFGKGLTVSESLQKSVAKFDKRFPQRASDSKGTAHTKNLINGASPQQVQGLFSTLDRMVREASLPKTSLTGFLEAAGNIPAAAKLRAHNTIASIKAVGTAVREGSAAVRRSAPNSPEHMRTFKRFGSLTEHLTTIMDPLRATLGSGNPKLARAAEDMIHLGNRTLKAVIDNPTLILPAPAEALNFARTHTAQLLRADIAKGVDRISDTKGLMTDAAYTQQRFISVEDSRLGVEEVEVTMMSPTGGFFKSWEQARTMGEQLKIGAFEPKQMGPDQYTLTFKRNINFKDDAIKDRYLLDLEDTSLPDNWLGTFLGRLMSHSDHVTALDRKNRGLGVHRQIADLTAVRELADHLFKLRKGKEKNRFRDIAEEVHTRLPVDAQGVPNGPPGSFFKDQGELEAWYHGKYGEEITERLTNAYWAAIKMNDLDYMLRNMAMYRVLAAQGAEEISIPFLQQAGELELPRGMTFTGAVRRETIQQLIDKQTDDGFRIGVHTQDGRAADNPNGPKTIVLDRSFLRENPAKVTELQGILDKEGWELVQIAQPMGKVVDTFLPADAKQPMEFILTRVNKREPLNIEQLPYREGFHQMDAIKYRVKQPTGFRKGNEYINTGDKTIFGHEVEANNLKWVSHFNEAQRLFNAEADGASKSILDRYVLDNGMPFDDGDEFRLQFEKDGGYSRTEKFYHVADGDSVSNGREMINDFAAKGIRVVDQRNSSFNMMAEVPKEFAGTRGDRTLTIAEYADDVQLSKPILKPARQVDPFESTQRTLSTLLRDNSIERVKQVSIDQFLEMAGKLDGKTAEYRANPVKAFHDYDPMTVPNATITEKQALFNAQRALLHFVGTSTPTAKHWQQIVTSLENSIFQARGQKAAESLSKWELGRTRDPSKFLRSTGFHVKLGMFNPVQIFVQAQTMVHTLAVAGPKHTREAVVGSTLMRYASLNGNPEILNKLADIASKSSKWTKDEFLEANRIAEETGWKYISTDTAWLDHADPSVMYKGGARFLDKASIFFVEAEKQVRMFAWTVAYREFKDANPGKAIKAKEVADIMDRAKLLSANMTRESNAAWQRGFAATPTQFFAYQARLMDQFWGTRLTRAEKTRALAVYSALYGIPGAMGAGGGVYPWGDEIKEQLVARGISPSDSNNVVTSLLVNGIPQTISGMLSSDGSQLNLSDRYAPGGLPVLKDLIEGDKDVFDVLGGAGGSILRDIFDDTLPFRKIFWGWMTGNYADYPLEMRDFSAALANVSSLSSAQKVWYAYNYQKYITTNGVPIGDMSTWQAFIRGVTGLESADYADAYRALNHVKKTGDWKKQAAQFAAKEYRIALQATLDGDAETAFNAEKRASAWLQMGGHYPHEYAAIRNKTILDDQDILAAAAVKVVETFNNPNATETQKAIYMHKFKRTPTNTRDAFNTESK